MADGTTLNLWTSNAVSVPDNVYSANSFGQASLVNTFSITGGSGPVDVTFSVMANLTQSLFTDGKGTGALSNAYYILSINSDGGNIVKYWSNEIGGDSAWSNSFSGTLSDTITLNFDQTYGLVSYANSELRASNMPEPTTGSLMLLGTGILGLAGTLRRKINL